MSNQSGPAAGRVAGDEPCCPPLAREPLTRDRAGDLVAMFKALGDPVRLRLVSMIASHEGGEACVCHLAPAFELSQPTISHHLRVLREAGLLTCQRRGTWVFYRVVPAALARLAAVLGPADLAVPTAPVPAAPAPAADVGVLA